MQDIISLYRHYNKFNQFTDEDLIEYLKPSIELNQYKKHYVNDKLIGFTNWAFLSDKAQDKFKQTGILDNKDWKSGDNIWHIETITIKNLKEVMSWTKHYFTSKFNKNKKVNWLRVRNNKIFRQALTHTKEHYKWVV